MKEI
ncbi:hypothetical protein BpHYR1_028017 [Brachionus plicatilis]|jgi:hypothetical protein